jgi:hypothetical protein
MKKVFTLLTLCAIALAVKAQQAPPTDEAYGKADQADLTITSCDFEKDANAEVLISTGTLYYNQDLGVSVDYHKRLKIFNDNGKDYANIKLEYFSADSYEYISGLQAETINLVDGKVEITKLDKKLIYNQPIDKYRSAIVFSMPNVKAGSIIEYKYTWNTKSPDNIPTWFFQGKIPVRYSALETNIPEYFYFSTQAHTLTPYSAHTTTQGNGSFLYDHETIPYSSQVEKRVMYNMPSLSDEPSMSSIADNLQRINFVLTTFKPPYGLIENFNDSWKKVGDDLVDNEDFGGQFKRKLTNEEEIINKAKTLKTNDEKIAYIFNEVKNTMKWDGNDEWYTDNGTCKAWDNKAGNSTEINLILYHLLKKSGVNALPMIVSTRENGKVNPVYTYLYQFNRAVVYIPVDSATTYVLDATGKYNIYNEIPDNLLNSSGLTINPDTKEYYTVFLQKTTPVRQVIFINADIKPDGKLSGTAQISSFDYNRINSMDRYKTDGEKKYIDYLRNDDNNLKISAIKFDNMDVDTLPLIQNVDFDLDLAGSDDNYIYVNPNLFTSLHTNPFLKEDRFSDIDFGYRHNLTVTAVFKIPPGYTADALPKNINMVMPDTSIVFRRIVGQQDGTIMIRVTIDYRKSIYFKEDYATFHEFFKKMYEMLNEQIVLKKS